MIDEIIAYLKHFPLIYLIILLVVPIFLGFSIKNILSFRKKMKKNNEYVKKLHDNKCKGPHSWVTMTIIGNESHVCKECYYCPDHEGFIKKEFVEAEVESKMFHLRLEAYKLEKIKEIGEEFGLDEGKATDIHGKLVSIQKDFTLAYIGEMMKKDREKQNNE